MNDEKVILVESTYKVLYDHSECGQLGERTRVEVWLRFVRWRFAT